MKDITKSDIDTLLKLQTAETEIVRIQGVIDKVKKEKDQMDIRLRRFEKAHEEKKEALDKISAFCREMENEVQLIGERIKKSNETLRFVKTNKEYQVLQREVDDNRKRKELLENELIDHMDEKEAKEKEVAESETDLEQLRQMTVAKKSEIDEKTVDDQEELDEYLARRAEISKHLDPDLMNQFNRISKMNSGLAVVEVKNEVCMGCYVNIPPQLYIEVQRFNSLILCPQCSRILCYIDHSE